MGFFGGNKKKPKEDATSDRLNRPRPSRRVVTPGSPTGGGAGAPAKPAAPAPAPTQGRQAQPPAGKPPTSRISRPSAPAAPGQAPAKSGDSDRGKVQPPPLMLGGDKPSPTPARPKSREPIVASKPLEFSGDLASGARNGPSRTGDAALLDFLVSKAHLLDSDQAAQVKNKAAQESLPIDSAAVQLGFISEDQLVNALTQECWVPHLKVDKYEIRKKALDTVSRDDAVLHGVFPVDKLGSLLTLAMVNPLDAETIRVLESKTGLDIKKVVATRSEITQGIEKYYSGKVQAKDTSISFTQDVEPKSVTQMLSNVKVADSPAPIAAFKAHDHNIVPEIEDIDDLLSSDEVIAPAIIEPISIEAIVDPEPATINLAELEPLPLETDDADPFADADAAPAPAAAPAPVAAKAKAKATADDGLLDLDIDISMPAAPAPAPAPVAKAAPAPIAPARPEAPVAPSRQEPSRPAAERPVAKPPVAPPRAPVAPPAANKPPTGRYPSTGRYTGTARHAAQPNVINLIPVMEEEFQHAITHGKAHVFEKWVGLQTRNRIINGVPIEEDLAVLLAGLYASPRRA